jgi:plasmid rolling circle replication initiator protein Rep
MRLQTDTGRNLSAPHYHGFDGTFQTPLSYSLDTVAQVSRNDYGNTDAEDAQLQVFERYTAKLYKDKEKSLEREKIKVKWTQKLERFGMPEHAERLRRCHADFASVLICGSGHKFKAIPAFRCYLPFCPDCVSEKAYRNIRAQLPKCLHLAEQHPELIIVLMTLTERSIRERSLRDGFKAMKASFRKLRTYPTYKHISDKLVGGVSACESTYNKKHRWHPHTHCLAFLNDYIPQKELSDAMAKISDSPIVDIRRTSGDLSKDVLECIKYPYKLADIDKLGKREILEILELKGSRLSVPFGKLHGLKAPPMHDAYSEFMEATQDLRGGDPCPVCWLPLFKNYNVSRSDYGNILPPPIVRNVRRE